jgi:hypothetical protein
MPYKILYHDLPIYKEGGILLGQINTETREIKLYDRDFDDACLFSTLLHEITHGISDELCLGMNDKENHDDLSRLAVGINDFLFRNKFLSMCNNGKPISKPKKVNILGIDYKIFYHEGAFEVDSEWASNMINCISREIRLIDSNVSMILFKSLLREVIYGVSDELCLRIDWEKNGANLTRLAVALNDFLFRNKFVSANLFKGK